MTTHVQPHRTVNDFRPLTRGTLRGVWSALIVPWTDDDRVDEARWAAECESYGGTGVSGVYTGGTTGEFYAQDDEAFEILTRIACESAHAVGLPVQIGCTALSTRTAARRIRVANRCGADGIQIAYPFWLELKPDEALGFFLDIAEVAGDTPIIIYHTSRCKRKLSPEEIGVIADKVPTFIGMKDTGCDLPTLKAMLDRASDLSIFGGEDFFERMQYGGRGGYCSVTGLNVRYIVDYYNHCAAGDFSAAREYADVVDRLLNEALLPLNHKEGLMDSAIDRLMRTLGGGDVGLRCQAPYRSASPEQFARVRQWCEVNAPFLLTRESPAGDARARR